MPNLDVTVHKADSPLGEILDELLNQFNWTYAVLPNGDVLVRPQPDSLKPVLEEK